MELLERQAQLDALTRQLRVAAGAGKIVFVSGEAGAGKSVLVEQFTQQMARSARVFWGHCDPLETSRVLGPVNEVFAASSAVPGTARESSLSREQLFPRLFERFSPPNPASILVLEDLHWADEATLDFVRFLGRRIQHTRCLLIATYRDDELTPTHPLRAVLGEMTGQHTARVQVPALSLGAVEQLAQGTGRDARRVFQVTGGNPFFVRELLSAPMDTVPETVRDAVLARLMHCTPAARELTEFVSLVPGRAETRLVRAILGNVDAAADDAVARGLLRYHNETLAFRHELGRLAVESTVPQSRAQALHRSILRVLVEHDADLSQLVHHASHAQDIKALLEYAPQAAEHAARCGAHREAVAYLVVALRHVESLSRADCACVFELHAIECNLTNQFSAALGSATRALALRHELGDVAAQARVLLLLGRLYWKTGQAALADRHVAEAIARLESLPPGRDLAMAYSSRSQLAMLGKRVADALEFGRRALDLAAQFGDYGVQTHALNNMGTALLCSGAQGGLGELQQSLAVALAHDLREHAGRAYANLASSLICQRSTLAERYVIEGNTYCEVHDLEEYLPYMRAWTACFELNRGDWDKAAALAAAQVLERGETLVPHRLRALVTLALARARRGDPGVDALLDEALPLALATCELLNIGPVAAARAEVAWYRGDLKRVTEEARIGLKAAVEQQDAWIQGELGYWAWRADSGLKVSVDLLAEPYALMIEGDWKGAAEAWQQRGAPYERALALADGPEEALRESLSILEQLRAGPLTTIVRQRLRALGARGIPRGPRASTRENPAGLTSREIQVLALLVRGHTNTELAARLHVSPKTVEHHVSSILEKLEVHSRTEAVAAAFALGIVKAGSQAGDIGREHGGRARPSSAHRP